MGGGLEKDRVAGGQRGRELVRSEIVRPVVRDESQDWPPWLPLDGPGEVFAARIIAEIESLRALDRCQLRRESKRDLEPRDLSFGPHDGLSDLINKKLREPLLPMGDFVGDSS